MSSLYFFEFYKKIYTKIFIWKTNLFCLDMLSEKYNLYINIDIEWIFRSIYVLFIIPSHRIEWNGAHYRLFPHSVSFLKLFRSWKQCWEKAVKSRRGERCHSEMKGQSFPSWSPI